MSDFSISVDKPGFRLAFKTFWKLNFDFFGLHLFCKVTRNRTHTKDRWEKTAVVVLFHRVKIYTVEWSLKLLQNFWRMHSLCQRKGYFDIPSSALLFYLTLFSEWEHGNHQILVFKSVFFSCCLTAGSAGSQHVKISVLCSVCVFIFMTRQSLLGISVRCLVLILRLLSSKQLLDINGIVLI